MTRVPLARRCPHGNDQHVCCTCVEATKAAEDYVHRTRAALAAQPTPAAVPPGYALVPIEPTYEINKAIRMAVRAGCFDDGIYRAMIAAAGDKP